MNELFNGRRFMKLFIKHTADHYKNYIMSLLVLAGVMIVGGSFFAYMFPWSIDLGFQQAMFGALLLLAGTIFTSTIFSDLGEKRKSIPMLTLPATPLEKFLVGWVYSYLLFIILFTAIFYIVLSVLLNVQSWHHYNMEILPLFQEKNFIVLLIFSLLHAFTIYGAILFEKWHFIKTGFIFFIFFIVIVFLNSILLKGLLGAEIFPAIPFTRVGVGVRGASYQVIVDANKSAWVIIIIVMITFLFWAAAYFRLKEKQV
ncbi:MAG: hypothetical protein JST87_05605 [Bacteroidetes bacterium]|nr:hypothetical protein [Bacteroidota bacterium]